MVNENTSELDLLRVGGKTIVGLLSWRCLSGWVPSGQVRAHLVELLIFRGNWSDRKSTSKEGTCAGGHCTKKTLEITRNGLYRNSRDINTDRFTLNNVDTWIRNSSCTGCPIWSYLNRISENKRDRIPVSATVCYFSMKLKMPSATFLLIF